MLIYELAWNIFASFLIPFTLRHERYRKRWVIDPPKNFESSIWIHALSVGEVLSCLPLVDAIKEEFSKEIVFTVTTEKGMEIAEKKLKDKVSYLTFFPFDFWWSVKRFTDFTRPDFFILIETDVWPFLLSYLSSKNIKSFLVNGRISPKSFSRYKKLRSIAKYVFSLFEVCMVQSEEERRKFIRLGIPEDKVINTGNIKFDREIESVTEKEKSYLRDIFCIKKEVVWIAGSTHPGEEDVILSVFKRIKEGFPDLILLLAPRNIERAREIFWKVKDMGFSCGLRTKDMRKKKEVYVIDTIGELSRIYSIADLVFVGGSLVPFGGHNIIEPASFGCPIIFGPYMFNFKEITQQIIKSGGGILVRNEEELEKEVLKLLSDKCYRKKIGDSSYSFVQKNRGATKKVISVIKSRI